LSVGVAAGGGVAAGAGAHQNVDIVVAGEDLGRPFVLCREKSSNPGTRDGFMAMFLFFHPGVPFDVPWISD
jgi:hypothetical protein